MSSMKQTSIPWIGDIPSDWALGKVKYGFERKKEKSIDTNPVVLSLARSGVKVRDISTNEGQLAASYEGYNPVEPGDLLLNPMDLISGANCSISYVSGVISPAYMNLRAKKGFDPRFYDYYFKTQYWSMALFAHGKGVSFDNRWTLNESTLRDYWIPMPSFEEQEAIANYLDNRCSQIDEIISETTTSIQEYKELKQAEILKAVTKGLDKSVQLKESGVDCIGAIPQGWNIKRFKYVASVNSNLVAPDEYLNYQQIAPDCIEKDSGRLVKERTVAEAGVESWNQLFQKGQLIYSKIRPTLNKVIIAPYDGLCSADMYPLDVKEDVAFIQKAMLSRYFVEQVGLITQDRVKMPKINKEELANIYMAIPPRDEQLRIVEYLNKYMSDIDAVIDGKQDLIDDLHAYKKALIFEVVTGKRKVVC